MKLVTDAVILSTAEERVRLQRMHEIPVVLILIGGRLGASVWRLETENGLAKPVGSGSKAAYDRRATYAEIGLRTFGRARSGACKEMKSIHSMGG